MASTGVAVLLFLFLVNIVQSEDDKCETVRFLRRKVAVRCCQVDVDPKDVESLLNNTKVTTISDRGMIFRCEDMNEAKVDVPTTKTSQEGQRNKSEITGRRVPDLTNRNIMDAPDRCPDGTTVDHAGECVEVWD